MANTAVKTSNLVVRTSMNSDDRFLILTGVGNSAPKTTTIARDNVTLKLSANAPPSASPMSSTSFTVTQGTAWQDGNFIYVATANNHVKRAPLSDF